MITASGLIKPLVESIIMITTSGLIKPYGAEHNHDS